DRLRARRTLAAYAADPPVIVNQSFDRGICLKLHVCECNRPPPDVMFEQPAAHYVALKSEVARLGDGVGCVVSLAARAVEGDVDAGPEAPRAELLQFLDEAGIEQGHHMLAAEQ